MSEDKVDSDDSDDGRIVVDLDKEAKKAWNRYFVAGSGNPEAREWNLTVLGQIALTEILVDDNAVLPHLKSPVHSKERPQACERMLRLCEEEKIRVRQLREQRAKLLGTHDKPADDEDGDEPVFEEPPKLDNSKVLLSLARLYMRAWAEGDSKAMKQWLRELGELKAQEMSWPALNIRAAGQLLGAWRQRQEALQREVDELIARRKGAEKA